MAKFIPKSIAEDKWKKFIPNRDFGIRCNQKESVIIRLGTGIGLYYQLTQTKSGSLEIKTIDYETGDSNVLAPFPEKKSLCIGRVQGCDIVAKHAIVSRNHAEIEIHGNVLRVKDLGSTNGTSVLKETVFFDIQEYLDQHPVDQQKDGTLDWLHEEFGPTLNDYLTHYSKEKNK